MTVSQTVPCHVSLSALRQILYTHHSLRPLVWAHNDKALCVAALCLLHGTVRCQWTRYVCGALDAPIFGQMQGWPLQWCVEIKSCAPQRLAVKSTVSGNFLRQSWHHTLKTHFMRLDSRTRSTERPCRRSLEATSAAPDCNEASMATSKSSTWHMQAVVGELLCAMGLQNSVGGCLTMPGYVPSRGKACFSLATLSLGHATG